MKWLYFGQKKSEKRLSKCFQKTKVWRSNLETKPQTLRRQSQKDLSKGKGNAPSWVTPDEPGTGLLQPFSSSVGAPSLLFPTSDRKACGVQHSRGLRCAPAVLCMHSAARAAVAAVGGHLPALQKAHPYPESIALQIVFCVGSVEAKRGQKASSLLPGWAKPYTWKGNIIFALYLFLTDLQRCSSWPISSFSSSV